MSKTDLASLLAQLDQETRRRWEEHLLAVDAEVSERGPSVAHEHLEAALEHLLALGWALHRCYATEEATVLGPLGDAAATVEALRKILHDLPRKPEWSQ